MNSLRDDPSVRAVLDELHAASLAQDTAIDAWYAGGAERPTGYEPEESATRAFWRDKLVALEQDKAELVYALARAVGATSMVEAGTSFGVSTIYLAAAVADNGGGQVITCDIEPTKMAVAEANLERAGLRAMVECRVGDIRHTLAGLDRPVDLLLLDIWAPVAGEVAELVGPHIRMGGMIVADNTGARRALYQRLLAWLAEPANGFTTQTLPFAGGLEVAVRTSPAD